ncbi:MAG: YgdI/YgdR family lipoprotein [Deltaproteobacteria bacterium]|nr:YgdI/YgdR family lipoprotein [Deltaproteobacteria bacterium]
MKKILPAIAAALFLFPATGFPAYIIHLHDGTKFVTDQYYEQGDQIRFKRYGGTIGIEKALVREIEEIEDLPEETEVGAGPGVPTIGHRAEDKVKMADGTGEGEAAEAQGIEEVKMRGEKTETREAEQSEAAAKEIGKEELDPEKVYKERKKALVEKLEEALERYKRAKETGEQGIIDAEFRRASELSSDLSDLEKEVKARHGGTLPAWWEETENAE